MPLINPSQAYSNIADKYDRIYDNLKCRIENNFVKKIITDNNIQEGDVLDLGCGTGNFLDWFPEKSMNEPHRFWGVDISKKMIDVAENKFPQSNFRVGDMADSSMYQGNMDSIISLFGSFSYCLKPEKVIELSYNNLKTNGNFLIMPLTPKWAYFQSKISFSNGVASTQLLYTDHIINKIMNGFTINKIYGFPVLLDMIAKKHHDSKFICNILKPLDKFLSTRLTNLGAYLIIHATKKE
jgi:ubiquinone/menaquinone biosynthesis C-methylase UbiE|tara:strand:- start:1342 stop:2058 length:717 start_codon:yes stop_codon:yes gene_type:complete